MHVRTIPTRALPALVAASLAASLLASAAPAEARSRSSSSSSGRAAYVSWTQRDAGPDATPGNFHTGYFDVTERQSGAPFVHGGIQDWECPDGVEPWDGYSESDEPNPEPACEWLGFRPLSSHPDLQFTMDKKLNRARLWGRIDVAHGAATPMVDITWTGTGSTYESTYTERWTDGTTTGTTRYRSTSRSATISGFLAQMDFFPETSDGGMHDYRESYRTRSR